MRWLRRHPVISGLCVVLVGAIVAAVVLWRVAGSSDPVSEEEALAAFRGAPGGGSASEGPRPGVYVYAATGTETGGAGPLKITRKIPSVARLVVTSRTGGWDGELSYSRQHIEGARYELRDGGWLITWRRTKVTFAGFGQDDRRTVEPPSLFVPARLRVGAEWSETFRTGDLIVRARTTVSRSEMVAVGGRQIPAFVILSRSTTEGPHPGTREETYWWAPALRLPVRWDVDMDIGGTFSFRTTSRLRLSSITPQV